MTVHTPLLTTPASLALVLPLALVTALCLLAPALALPAVSVLSLFASHSQLRGAGSAPVPRESSSATPDDVLTHPP